MEVAWPSPLKTEEGSILLASKAKGIYKPAWSEYALSVRQSIGGPYPDRGPVVRSDGSWLYAYFQEGDDPKRRDDEATNRGLMACLRDQVPIGVLRQTTRSPRSQYLVLGVALVSSWEDGYFYLEGFSSSGHAQGAAPACQLSLLLAEQLGRTSGAGDFSPCGVLDARERTLAQIVRRRGQPEFRRRLLNAYEGKCCISACSAVDALEAAHITPYLGTETNNLRNGLLLRADLHTLFDLGLLAIDPTSRCVLLANELLATEYALFLGRTISEPLAVELKPSYDALHAHRIWAGL